MKKHGEHRTGAGPLWVFVSAACCALPRFPTVHPGVLSSSPAAPPVSSSSAGASAASVSPDPECLKSGNAPCPGLFPVLSRPTLCRCSPPPPRSSPQALPSQKHSETILPLSTSLSESLFPASTALLTNPTPPGLLFASSVKGSGKKSQPPGTSHACVWANRKSVGGNLIWACSLWTVCAFTLWKFFFKKKSKYVEQIELGFLLNIVLS